MNNKQKFDKSNITRFKELGLTGKDIKVAIIESYTDSDHVEKTEGVIRMIAPNVETKRFSARGDMEEVLKEISRNNYDLVNCSYNGGTLVHYPSHINFSQNSFIVASSGNSGKEEYKYPASNDKVLAVGATEDGKTIPIYSTKSDKLDCVNFTDIKVTGKRFPFGGTSASAPYTTGMLALYIELYERKFKRKPDIREITEYVWENCKDLYSPGHDIKSGYGLFILNENIREKIYDWKNKKYIDKIEWIKKARANNLKRRGN